MIVTALTVFEPQPGNWIWLSFFRLLATALILTPIVAVLGARWPGERAWNLIVLSLLVVFSLPVLEQWLLGKQLESDRVGIDGPRLAFFSIVATVGIVNYVATRYGLAALLLCASIVAQLSAVGPWRIGNSATGVVVTSVAAILASAAAWSALALRSKRGRLGVEGAWLRFRDGWGIVWSMRLRDRWNAAAKQHEWPVRLNWTGFQPVPEARILTKDESVAAEQQFRQQMRRFVNPDEWIQCSGFRIQERTS